MTSLLLLLLCVSAPAGTEIRAAVESAGIKRVCAETDLSSRESLPSPGITARANLASPTRIPWIVANGWRFTRNPRSKYVYDVPAGKAALAAAEAHAYGVDAALKIDPADAAPLSAMLTFLEALPALDLPVVADLAVVDDLADHVTEVPHLLRELVEALGGGGRAHAAKANGAA